MTDPFSDLFDLATLCVGLVAIAWLGWREIVRRKFPIDRSVGLGMLVWVVSFGFALYLIFG
jgi:hypothetical protein